uniref:Uncharacterized protein n=1 Tax=Romanomermis culicivorax TaxID=13658 RepID=A0A915KLH3_ROMCU
MYKPLDARESTERIMPPLSFGVAVGSGTEIFHFWCLIRADKLRMLPQFFNQKFTRRDIRPKHADLTYRESLKRAHFVINVNHHHHGGQLWSPL